MNILDNSIFQILIEIIVFFVIVFIGTYLVDKLENSGNKYLDLKQFLPEDEISTLKQVFYLIVMGACFFVVIYTFVSTDILFLSVFDVILSILIAIRFDKSSRKNKIILFLLVPWGSLNFILFELSIAGLLDIIHIPVFIYFIKYYYDKFNEYTHSNGLGVTILLLFSIVFISFLLTQVTEGKNPVDALVMVSNAFTSNGFAILGNSLGGKLNSVFLVWSGYVISGAGTATLTAAILMRHFNKRFKELEQLIENGDDE